MKNLIILFALILNLSSATFSQDFRLTGASATLGKGSVFSGYDIKLEFTNPSGQQFAVTGNHTRMHVGYTWKVSSFNLTASGGYNKNTPWIGPKVNVFLGNHVTTLHWLAIAAGEPEKPSFDIQIMFALNAVYAKVWRLQFSYSLLHWLQEAPQHIPGAFYCSDLGDKWSFNVGAEYNLTKDEPLFQFFLKKSF